MLDLVRTPLLEEARHSPNLLSDLAGLEEYLSESYNTRSFIELLQNADDARSQRFLIARQGPVLVAANDGRPFTQADFESLCRSAASHKQRGESIGYRGIGFKSVVSFAQQVFVFSGDLAATFSRERTRREVPTAKRVPLVRVPHPVEADEIRPFQPLLAELLDNRFSTVFVFLSDNQQAIENEFAAFDPTALLFLRSIRQVELRMHVQALLSLRRQLGSDGSQKVQLSTPEGVEQWWLRERDEVTVAFLLGPEGVVRLDERRAVVHAFLPTHERTGVGVKIHGDISTDPSRTRVVLDERTGRVVERAAAFLVELLEETLELPAEQGPEKVAAALLTQGDPRAGAFLRPSFERELLQALLRHGQVRFKAMRLQPPWLKHAVDFEKVIQASELPHLPRALEGVPRLPQLLRALGAQEATLDDLSRGLLQADLTLAGAAEVVAYLCGLLTTGQIQPERVDRAWKLWPVGDRLAGLTEAQQAGQPFPRAFLDLVREKLGNLAGLQRLLTRLTDTATAAVLLPAEKPPAPKAAPAASSQEARKPRDSLRLTRYLAADKQVESLLTAEGWKLRNVREQNLGGDLEGANPEGQAVLVKVIRLLLPGEPFQLTTTEEATARDKKEQYVLALVLSHVDSVEIALIPDPTHRLTMTRTCRQWVWQCDEYTFDAQRFPLE